MFSETVAASDPLVGAGRRQSAVIANRVQQPSPSYGSDTQLNRLPETDVLNLEIEGRSTPAVSL